MSIIERVYRRLYRMWFRVRPKRVVAMYKVFFGDEWFEASIRSIVDEVDGIAIVITTRAWSDTRIEGDDLVPLIERLQAEFPGKIAYRTGAWDQQIEHVSACLPFIRERFPKATHVMYIDSDELFDAANLALLMDYVRDPQTTEKALHATWYTYFKSIHYRIDPPEPYKPLVLFPLFPWTVFTEFRKVNTSRMTVPVMMHHFSYVRRSDDRIRDKLNSYRKEEPLIGNWYEDVWLKWTPDMRDFHPAEPEKYHRVERVEADDLPPEAVAAYAEWSEG